MIVLPDVLALFFQMRVVRRKPVIHENAACVAIEVADRIDDAEAVQRRFCEVFQRACRHRAVTKPSDSIAS